MKIRKANLNVMYNEFIRVSGINDESLMSDIEKIERKRSFMAGIHFFHKFIGDNLTRLTSAKAGDMLRDVERQLKQYWKDENDRDIRDAGDVIDWDYDDHGDDDDD